MKSSVPIVLRWGSPSAARCFTVRARSKRPLLATTTRSVTSRRTGLAALRNEPHATDPDAASALLPDDLPAQQQAELLEDAADVGRQAAVGLAPEVGDVDRDAPARLEHAHAVGEHRGEHVEVLEVRRRDAVALELLLVLLAGEVRRRRDDEGHRGVGDGVHRPGVAAHERLGDGQRRALRGRRRQLGGGKRS